VTSRKKFHFFALEPKKASTTAAAAATTDSKMKWKVVNLSSFVFFRIAKGNKASQAKK
jgi:hypothetical protein